MTGGLAEFVVERGAVAERRQREEVRYPAWHLVASWPPRVVRHGGAQRVPGQHAEVGLAVQRAERRIHGVPGGSGTVAAWLPPATAMGTMAAASTAVTLLLIPGLRRSAPAARMAPAAAPAPDTPAGAGAALTVLLPATEEDHLSERAVVHPSRQVRVGGGMRPGTATGLRNLHGWRARACR
ncbi:MAG: hypothetical protein ACRDPY_42550 [Streptosporangiaceae bacterium]